MFQHRKVSYIWHFDGQHRKVSYIWHFDGQHRKVSYKWHFDGQMDLSNGEVSLVVHAEPFNNVQQSLSIFVSPHCSPF